MRIVLLSLAALTISLGEFLRVEARTVPHAGRSSATRNVLRATEWGKPTLSQRNLRRVILKESASTHRQRKIAAGRSRRKRAPLPPPTLQTEPEAQNADLLPNQRSHPATPLPVLDARSHILLLSEKGGVIAKAGVTARDEPVHLRSVTVTFTAAVPSVSSLEISDDLGFVLGTASRDLQASSKGYVFTLDLSASRAYYLEGDDTIVLAVRPFLKEEESGGASGETVEVDRMTVSSTGVWSMKSSLVSVSSQIFQKHQTANARITGVKRESAETSAFGVGTQKPIGAFRFEVERNRDAEPAFTGLTFSVSAPSAVSLSNAKLSAADTGTSHDCTVSSGAVTCSSIPAAIGAISSSPRTITVLADVSVGSHPNPFLQLELNTPGHPDSAGAITWTDGDTSFTWVPLEQPIVQGTLWK